MHVLRLNRFDELRPCRMRWDQLAGNCVFRSYAWLETWWKYYAAEQPSQELEVFLVMEGENSPCQLNGDSRVLDVERLVAILPCYSTCSFARGKVLRLLGDGEVCSDHLELLADPIHAKKAANALAEYLTKNRDDWDLINFSTIDANSSNWNCFLTAMQARECLVHRAAGPNSWSIELPNTWEEFLSLQSKSHRKQLRRLEKRILQTRQGIWHLARTQRDLEIAWPILIDLHQRRRNSLGEPGCFASERWASFHCDIAKQLLDSNHLRLSWLELGGQPAAAEYHFAGTQTTSAYQGGIAPERTDEEPGRLSMICTIQHAISEGHTKFDLLRGDEPYKPHWRATPQQTCDVQIVPARSTARWRFQAWRSLRSAGRIARQFSHDT